MKISIIIPYKNEEKDIILTAKKILKQSYKKYEVIFINSNSKDSSFKLLNNFILKNKLKNFRNISRKTLFPSDSKNMGIKLSKYNYVSFMDCGLEFDKDWLKNQKEFIKKNKQELVLGNLFSSASLPFEKAIISQTWGLNRIINVIPGTLIKKKLFKRIGNFKILRAGYDRFWISNIKKKIRISDNQKNLVKYRNVDNSNNLLKLYNKICLYSYYSSYIYKKKMILYLLMFILFLIFATYVNFVATILFYIFLRFIYPFLKSKQIYELLEIRTLLYLIPVGFVIDFARIFGYFKRLFNFT